MNSSIICGQLTTGGQFCNEPVGHLGSHRWHGEQPAEQGEKWPTKGIWGAMRSADNDDSYHLHRWIDEQSDDYEQLFALFGEREEVERVANYLNALEAKVTRSRPLTLMYG